MRALEGLLQGEDLLLRAVFRGGVFLGGALEDINLRSEGGVGLLGIAAGGFEGGKNSFALGINDGEGVLELGEALLKGEGRGRGVDVGSGATWRSGWR